MPPPPPRKKRKTASGAVAAVVAAGGTRRTTRSQKTTLSIEMVGKVASFADYGDDLMSICKAVGRRDSAVIRHACLRNNMGFLQRTLENYVDDRTGSRCDNCKSNIRVWMEINTDWRKHCSLVRTEDDELRRYIRRPRHWNEKGDEVLRTDPLLLFNNPAVAIEFDLVDVLKHLVEVIDIDVNGYGWGGLKGGVSGCHLLVGAMFEPRGVCLECFKYMLSREDIDVFSGISAQTEYPIWEAVLSELEDFSNATFEAIVRHSSFDPNRPNFSTGSDRDPLPLHQAVYQCFIEGSDSDLGAESLKRAEILLGVGADPALRIEDPRCTNLSPMNVVAHLIHHLRDREGEESRVQLLTELDAIMKRYSQGSS